MPEQLEQLHFTVTMEQITNKTGKVQTIRYITCNHCGYKCRSRVEKPKKCSRCQKDLWNWRENGQGEQK